MELRSSGRHSASRLFSRCSTIAIFVVAAGWFSFRAAHSWLASGFMDPVAHLGTQDEAVYSRVVLEMLGRRNWLVPTFLDRLAYFKPPLLYWLAAASLKCLGASAYSLRLPSVLAAAGVCAISWAWVRQERGAWPASITAILIAGDSYWVMMGSLNMTDSLLVFFSVAALWIVARDAEIERIQTVIMGACCLAAAILTKSAAGLIPAICIAAYCRSRRLWPLGGLTLALACPWFVYSLIMHRAWFWNEHVLTELLGNSVGANAMPDPDANLSFYASRLFRGDPFIAWFGLLTLIAAVWKRRAHGLALLWFAVTCAALLLFRYHAASYLLPLVTALAITVGFACPPVFTRWQIVAALSIAAGLGVLLYFDREIIWNGTNVASARALETYCERGRKNGLMILQPDDEFYSAVLPLPKVLYGSIDFGDGPANRAIDWRYLGVAVTADEFADRARWWPIFRSRLARMGLEDSLDPRGAQVLIRNQAAVSRFIRSHPELDFFLPSPLATDPGNHVVAAGTPDRVFLLSTISGTRATRGFEWSCRVGGF